MDIGILAGIGMLMVWAIGVWYDGPGWLNGLLTLGVFVIIWRIVVRGDRRHPNTKP
jgi:hypothetical protein